MKNDPRQQVDGSDVCREEHDDVSRVECIEGLHVPAERWEKVNFEHSLSCSANNEQVCSDDPEYAERYASVDEASNREAAVAEALEDVAECFGVRAALLRQAAEHQVDGEEENHKVGAEPAGKERRSELVFINMLLSLGWLPSGRGGDGEIFAGQRRPRGQPER